MTTQGLTYLHYFDSLSIKDTKNNLVALWAKAIMNNLGCFTYYDSCCFDFLPSYTRIVARWPLCLIWIPTMKHSSVIQRVNIMDKQLLLLFKQISNYYNNYDKKNFNKKNTIQLINFGCGFDTKCVKFLKLIKNKEINCIKTIEVDLKHVVKMKDAILKRFLKRQPNILDGLDDYNNNNSDCRDSGDDELVLPWTLVEGNLMKNSVKELLASSDYDDSSDKKHREKQQKQEKEEKEEKRIGKNVWNGEQISIFVFEAVLGYLYLLNKHKQEKTKAKGENKEKDDNNDNDDVVEKILIDIYQLCKEKGCQEAYLVLYDAVPKITSKMSKKEAINYLDSLGYKTQFLELEPSKVMPDLVTVYARLKLKL